MRALLAAAMLALCGTVLYGQSALQTVVFDRLPNPAAGGGGTVVFDAVASGSLSSVNGPLTWTHTPVGTPTQVAVGIENYTGQCTTTSVTYGSTSLTKANSITITGQNTVLELWGAANPVSGAQTVTVNLTGSSCFTQAGSITVTGGSTSTTFDATNTAQGSSASPSVSVTSATGELIVDVVGNTAANVTQTAGGSQTKRWGTLNAGSNSASGSTLAASAGSTSMSWTLGTSEPWGQVAGSFHN